MRVHDPGRSDGHPVGTPTHLVHVKDARYFRERNGHLRRRLEIGDQRAAERLRAQVEKWLWQKMPLDRVAKRLKLSAQNLRSLGYGPQEDLTPRLRPR